MSAKQKLLLGLIVICILSPAFAEGQELLTSPHTSSTISPADRFQIIQSQLVSRWTFRLDRVCGNVSQLVGTKDGGTAWEPMPIELLPECQLDGKTRYQLFLSSLAAKYSFLMNTNSGMSWVLTLRPAVAEWVLFRK
jgi:hypothetical protein